MRLFEKIKGFASTRPGVVLFGCLAFTTSLNLLPQSSPVWILRYKLQNIIDEKLFANERSHRFEDTTLLTSIFSIMQTYYVDTERATTKNILKILERQLNGGKIIHIDVEPSYVRYQASGQPEKIVQVSEPPTLSDVIEVVQQVSSAMSTAKVPSIEKVPKSNVAVLTDLILQGLDSHSSLLTPELYKELRQGTDGTFGGLGVLVGVRDQLLTVIKPLPRSPALRSGIQKHDHILSINGVDTYGASLDQLVEFMRGDPGSKVDLSILRKNSVAPFSVKLTREIINVDSVTSKEIKNGSSVILHLTIESFSSRTSREVWAAIKESRARHRDNLAGLILDLRSNPGGLLDQAVQVADLFLKAGVIVSTKGRRQEVETADVGYDEVGFPMAVLVDTESASASEIVAGALQDHNRAIVIGQPSFGKGSVQTIFELPDDYALKLTIARYYTPNGRSIQNRGIMPDIWMQPVITRKKNENLLGQYRYKSERFLENHLEERLLTNDKDRTANFIGYYLKDESEVLEGLDQKRDRELDMALKILSKVNRTYGKSIPEPYRRATNWLALSSKEIQSEIDKMDSLTDKWLESTHKISWTKGNSSIVDLDFKLASTKSYQGAIGDIIPLEWTVTNNKKHPVSRISIVARSDSSMFETNEIMIGTINPGERKTGVINARIPQTNTNQARLILDLAEEGQLADVSPIVIPISILSRSRPELVVTSDLTNEIGGSIPQTVEVNEQSNVRITITNNGAVSANQIQVELINLAGKQIDITRESKTIARIEPSKSIFVEFKLKAGKSIISSKLPMGVSISSTDLEAPLRKQIFLQSNANSKQLIGH
jgi:carboxyl-terminal processing protease